ncbi:hypothetical protein ACI2KR_08430 [Pseudomonas luteola]
MTYAFTFLDSGHRPSHGPLVESILDIIKASHEAEAQCSKQAMIYVNPIFESQGMADLKVAKDLSGKAILTITGDHSSAYECNETLTPKKERHAVFGNLSTASISIGAASRRISGRLEVHVVASIATKNMLDEAIMTVSSGVNEVID